MFKSTFADTIATEMDRILRDNASNAAIEKVATEMPIKRVSDEQPSEVEKELEDSVANATKSLDKTAQHKTSESKDCGPCKGYYVKDKTAGACACDCKSMGECKNGCACHSSPPKPAMDWKKSTSSDVVNTLLKASEELDSLGFSKYATLAVVMAAKVSKKKTTKDSKKDKEMAKSKSKKTTEKAKSKKSDKAPAKKDSKKSSKK